MLEWMVVAFIRSPNHLSKLSATLTAPVLSRYVVKTLDNAESVKLQYRSLAKFVDGGGGEPPAVVSNGSQNASWL